MSDQTSAPTTGSAEVVGVQGGPCAVQRPHSAEELGAACEPRPIAPHFGAGGVPPILDACCGSRMFWFDRTNPLALYMDKREEQHVLCDGRELKISPDVVADFTDMPFQDESFWLVVFDPPHMNSLGENSWLAKKYGRLIGDWRDDLREGFSECFRVLKTNGTLVFKWNTTDISLEEVLALAPCPPVFGHTTGRQAKTVWATFFKGGGGGIRRVGRAHRWHPVNGTTKQANSMDTNQTNTQAGVASGAVGCSEAADAEAERLLQDARTRYYLRLFGAEEPASSAGDQPTQVCGDVEDGVRSPAHSEADLALVELESVVENMTVEALKAMAIARKLKSVELQRGIRDIGSALFNFLPVIDCNKAEATKPPLND